MKHLYKSGFCIILLLAVNFQTLYSAKKRTFVHPGASISNDDIANMKAHIAAKEEPWYSEWQALQSSKQGQSTYTAAPNTEIGGSDGNRQRASNDAVAALYNCVEWRITGDTKYADCAARILSAWGNMVQTANEQLFQFPILDMCLAAEMLRHENGSFYTGWAKADRDTFLAKVRRVFVPACRNQVYNLMTSWSAPANACILSAGVLLDDEAIYNEGLSYYRSQSITGSVYKGILASGQVPEMARDNVHAMLTLGDLAYMAQIGWNQGDDLFAEGNNRILKGFDYWCRFNSGHDDTPFEPIFTYYNNTVPWPYISTHDNGYRLRPDGTNFEIVYHHFKEVKGLDESNYPYLALFTKLGRPERDFRSLFYPRSITTSPVFTKVPAKAAGIKAEAGINFIQLSWTHPAGEDARGFKVYRSTDGITFSSYVTFDYYTNNKYLDYGVTSGTKYYYKVALINKAGESNASDVVYATSDAGSANIPDGWAFKEVETTVGGGITYSPVQGGTFKVDGGGDDLWASPDAHGFAYTKITGDFELSGRLNGIGGTLWKMGILARETLSGNSKRVALTIGDTGFRICYMNTRFNTDGGSSLINGCDFSFVPVWTKIKRVGNNFSAYQSRDSVNWYCIGTNTVSMASTIYAGIFVSSRSTDLNKTQATYDHVKVVGAKPAGATGFTAKTLSSTEVQLSWTASTSATTYQLKRATSATGPFQLIKSALNALTFKDSTAVASTQYYYVLKAANGAGLSTDSATLTIKTPARVIPPAPSGFKVLSGNNKNTLTWSVTDESPTNYNVKRAAKKAGPYTTIGTPTTVTYVDNTALNDSTYYYTVSAVNSLGEGSNSDSIVGSPSLGQLRYWPFDETGTTRTAVCAWTGTFGYLQSTGANWSASPASKYNGALYLQKTATANAYVSILGAFMSAVNDFSISAWVKLDTVAANARLFDFGTGTTSYMYFTPKSATTGFARFAITTSGSAGEQAINANIALIANAWYHVAITLEGSVGTLYINGVQFGQNTAMTKTPASLGTASLNYIGKSQTSTDPYFRGYIDEFRIYKQALTRTQLGTLRTAKLQTITFDSIPEQNLDSPDFTPVAVASSGLPVSFKSSNTNVASITTTGNIHSVALGTCNITATQSGTLSLGYVAAVPVIRPLVVSLKSGVNDLYSTHEVSLFPNPVHETLNIKLNNSDTQIERLEVFNSNGQQVPVKYSVGNPTVINTKHLSEGVYFIRISYDNNTISRRFCKY